MAAVLEIDIQAKNNASKAFKESQDSAEAFAASILKIGAGVGIGLGLEQGIGKAKDLLTDMVKSAIEDEASQRRLKQAVEDTGASYNSYSKQLDEVVKRGQALGFQDDQTRSALSILTAQTGSAEEAMHRYALAQDLSRGANIDVVTASRLLGKVTEENVNVLARYGISVQKGSSETELFAAIQQKFGGQAAAFADTTAGKMAILGDQIHELGERFGALAIPPLKVYVGGLSETLENIDALLAKLKIIPDSEGNATTSTDKLKHSLWDTFVNNPVTNPLNTLNKTVEALGLGADRTASQVQASGQQFGVWTVTVANASPAVATLNANLSDLDRHLAGLAPELTAAGIEWSQFYTAATTSLHNTAQAAVATDQAWKDMLSSSNAVDAAAAAKHFADIQSTADAKADAEAKKEQTAAQRAFDDTLEGHVAKLQKDAEESDLSQQAMVIWAASMGHATDRMNNLLPSMNDLIKTKLDSYDATMRDNEANREANAILGLQVDINGNVVKSFQQMVNEQKASILASQQMEKATAEANKELGISTDLLTANTTALSANAAGWHQMTDAESQAAAKAKQPSTSSSGGSAGGASSSGGSVAFFMAGYGHAGGLPYVPYDDYPAILHKGEAVVTAAQNANGGPNIVVNNYIAGSLNGVSDVERIVKNMFLNGGMRGIASPFAN